MLRTTSTYILCFLALLSLCNSCKKPIPTGKVNDPELQFSGSINGTTEVWIAGIEGCTQTTEYVIDSLGLKTVIGKFENCKSGATLTIQLYQTQSNASLDDALTEGRRMISPDPMTSYYDVKFENESYSRSNVGFLWDFDDGTESNERNPERRFKADTNTYEVCLKATSNQITSEICQSYKPGNNCKTDFTWSLNPYKWKFFGEYVGESQVQWSWDFASGVSSQSKTVDYPYTSSVTQDKVCLTAEAQDGCSNERCQNVIVDSSQVDVVANFSYTEEYVEEAEPASLYNTSRIIYTNSTGEVFYSDGDDNAESSYLSISSVEAYKATSKGVNATKVSFNCEAVLKSESGERILLRNGEGTMAFRLEN